MRDKTSAQISEEDSGVDIPVSQRVLIFLEKSLKLFAKNLGGIVNITVLLLLIVGVSLKVYAYFNSMSW